MRILAIVWCSSMLLCSVLSLVLYFKAEVYYEVFRNIYILLLATQIIAVLLSFSGLYNRIPFLKTVFLLCLTASFAVIPGLFYVFRVFMAQYHVKIKDAIYADRTEYRSIVPGDTTTVYETKDLYVFFPEYKTINFVIQKPPKKKDRSITWFSAAAYQHDLLLNSPPENIEGRFASRGTYYEGAPLPQHKCGAFVFYDGRYVFDFDAPEKAIKTAAERGGDGFMQVAMIVNGRPAAIELKIPRNKCFRVLAELNGHLCIVDGKKRVNLATFVSMLDELGLSNALYMDMGAGWNYSWYRNAKGKIKMLFKLKLPWGKNWLIFRK